MNAVPNQMTTGYDIPEDYMMDMKPFLKRPFYLGQIAWSETNTKYQLLKTPVTHLPSDVILSNTSLRNAVRVGAMMKPSLELHIALNGTLTHAGCLLFGILPPGIVIDTSLPGDQGVYLVNTILSGPHVKLFANEATSAVLEVPWYCNTDMCETNIVNQHTATTADQNNLPIATQFIFDANDEGACSYATLACMVLNPLRPGAAVTSLTVTIEAVFTGFQLAVPTPRFIDESEWLPQSGEMKPPLWKRALTGLLDIGSAGAKTLYPIFGDAIDYARGAIRSYTGLHNFNIPIVGDRIMQTRNNYRNATDIPQFFEKIDPMSQYNRICNEPIFGTSLDEMNIAYIASKRQYLGSFDLSVDTPAGTPVWCRPISPFQGGGIGEQPYFDADDPAKQTYVCANNLELLHALHRYWRGDLTVTLEAVMNNKTHVKLKVIKYYAPARNVLLDKLPSMAALSNAPSQLLEFSAGAQRYCVDLPYLCKNELMPCAEDESTEAMLHGMYIIYLAQPIVVGDGSPTSVTVNVYMRGSQTNVDRGLQFYGYMHKNISLDRIVPNSSSFFSAPQAPNKAPVEWEPQSGSQACMPACTVPMNEPQEQDDGFQYQRTNDIVGHHNRLMPNVDIRPLMRRLYNVYSKYFAISGDRATTVTIPLATLLAESQQRSLPLQESHQYRNLALLSSMYHGKSCVGFKVRLEYRCERPIFVNAYYLPPSILDLKNSAIGSLVMAQYNTKVFDGVQLLDSYRPQLLMASNNSAEGIERGTYEFLIPDVNAYKFVGGPNKYRTPSFSLAAPHEDMGYLHIVVEARAPTIIDTMMYLNMNVGLTDESRFGFHTIAPIFTRTTGNTATYVPSIFADNQDQLIPKILLPKGLYLGHPGAT